MKSTLILTFTFTIISLKLVVGNPLDITDRNAIKSKCDDKELEKASDNYEECKQNVFSTMKDMRDEENQGNEILKKSANSDEKQILTILESTLSEGDNALCQALDKFINNCTTILGWCFTDEHVQATMKEQRDVSRSALAKMEVYCPETEDITKTNKTTTTTTTSIRTPTSSQDSELSELPRSAPSQSEADAEPGSAPTIGYSLTLFFLAITAHLFLYK